MVAFPSGQMGGGLPPSGGAFGPSTGKQSGMNWGSINQFLEGPFQDLTEGLASVITKDNAYRQYISEKRSKRRRDRLNNVLEPFEMVAGMIAKDPRVAKMFAPGGAHDDFFAKQAPLAKSAIVENGGDPSFVDTQMAIIAAMSQLPEEDTRSPFEKDIDTLAERGVELTDEELKKGAGVAVQAPEDQKLSEVKGADGLMKVMMMKPDGSTYVLDGPAYKPDRVAGDAEASVAQKKLALAFAAAGVPVGTPIEQLTLEQAQAVQAKLGSTDFLTNLIGALGANNAGGGGLGGVDLDAALGGQGAAPAAVPTGDGKPASDYKVGDKIAVDGVEATVTAVLPDGRLKIRAANGRTGTIVP
jgi:hypothetical protein